MKSRTRILIVEDSMGDAMLLTHMLREIESSEFEVTYIQDLNEAQALIQTRFDLILLDLHLSDISPLKTFTYISNLFSNIPIIILTGLKDDELAAKIVRKGAQDYLIKGTFSAQTLGRSLTYAIERKKAQINIAREKTKTRNIQTKADSFQEESHRLSELNKAKDIFLSVASHQLRTPATAVKQHLGMVLEGYAGPVNPGLLDSIKTAYESNERQLRLVDDMLSIARLEAGKVKINKRSIDIDKLLDDIINEQRRSFEFKKQSVVLTKQNEIKSIEIDPDNMRMVFENLLDNAGKYSPPNTRINVRAYKKAKKICVEIVDQGIGISSNDIPKLFGKFSRVDSSLEHAPNGSGLGLYWAKEIVKLHDGDIKLSSKPGRGTTFRVEIPA